MSMASPPPSSIPSSDKPNISLPVKKKKRLNRREQKARKKQRLNSLKSRNEEGKVEPLRKNENRRQDNDDNEGINSAQSTASNRIASLDKVGDDMGSYVPTPIPNISELTEQRKSAKTLGKWFPKAVVVKSTIKNCPNHHHNSKKQAADGSSNGNISSGNTDQSCCLLLFYQYVTPAWSEAKVEQLMAFLHRIAVVRGTVGGRIRVAQEGVNATLSSGPPPAPQPGNNNGSRNALPSAKTTLQHIIRDLKRFDEAFQQTDFKFIPNCTADRHFKDFKIFPVKELVFYGISEDKAPLQKGGVHLDPVEFHEKLQQDGQSTVVVDVRNHYEAAIGRFDGQMQHQKQDNKEGNNSGGTTTLSSGGAEYVDPKMRKSTDFPTWLAKKETVQKLQGKNVLLYCTGGVRCERASAFLNQKMGDSVKGVYQLQGGIERYLQAFPDGGHWRGKNFVFDKREAISADNPNGDGGVIKQKKRKRTTSSPQAVDTKCCLCAKPWDRYVGKKKCDTCGVPVLMCDVCMAKDSKKNKKKRDQLVRCPLCEEEGVTVRADQVELTANGVAVGKVQEHHDNNNNNNKVAPSVLKWGGGHAAKKKEKRRMKRRGVLCNSGKDCTRKDCFFSHHK